MCGGSEMTTRELLQMALEVLVEYVTQDDIDNKPVGNVVDALRAHLAKPEPAPVAWCTEVDTEEIDAITHAQKLRLPKYAAYFYRIPLYTKDQL